MRGGITSRTTCAAMKSIAHLFKGESRESSKILLILSIVLLLRLPHLVPDRIHLFQRGFGRLPAAAGKFGFDCAEAAFELGVGATQGLLGVDLQVTRKVGDGEKEIAEFFLVAPAVRIEAELGDFLFTIANLDRKSTRLNS